MKNKQNTTERQEEQTFTKEQVLGFTINILSEISIPAVLAETIGVPISKSITNLKVLQQMMEKEKADNAEVRVQKAEGKSDE